MVRARTAVFACALLALALGGESARMVSKDASAETSDTAWWRFDDLVPGSSSWKPPKWPFDGPPKWPFDGLAPGSSSRRSPKPTRSEWRSSSTSTAQTASSLSPADNAEALLKEYHDSSTGIAFSMASLEAWKSTKWGIIDGPRDFTDWAQTYVSIMTHKTDMAVYKTRSYGLALHIDPTSHFWKYFQVIIQGEKKGHIVGGPGDGGSHTPVSKAFTMTAWAAGEDYHWFKSQKDAVLAEYNSVYHHHDYNEFITNGLPKSAVAGVLRYTRSHQPGPTDEEMCNLMNRRVHAGRWPIYAYNRFALTIERYIDC